MAYRISIRYPSGRVEYRYGERLPDVGERLGRGADAGTVSAITLEGDSHATVTLLPDAGSSVTQDQATTTLYTDVPPSPSPRDRILEAAYDLFSQHGVRTVSIEDVVKRAGVSRATVYRHFSSKEDLVLTFLELREQRWTREWVENGARTRGASPEERLLAIFDVFDGWFRRADFEGCAFINVLLEMDGADPLATASRDYLAKIRTLVRTLAEEAELRDPEAFAHAWHVLMKGSIVAAGEGDTEAAQRAKDVARLLLEEHRRRAPVDPGPQHDTAPAPAAA